MSFWATAWAKEQRTGGAIRKCILLVIADYADEDGLCHPSQETISRQAELSLRCVRDHLFALEESGFITRHRRVDGQGHRLSDGYQLSLPAKFAVRMGSYRQMDASAPSTISTSKLSKNSKKKKTTLDAGAFTQAWRAYPKRLGGNSRADAEKAWKARIAQGYTADQMIDGTIRYALFCELSEWVGTGLVMQAKRFYGSGLHFTEEWEAGPPRKRPQREDEDESAYIGRVV